MATTITNLQPATPAAPPLDAPVLPPLAAGAQGRVSLIEIARLAAESLLANKVRSLLTMLGVIIGVASVIALLAIGNGATASITSQVQALGTNVLTIRAGSPNNRTPGQAAGAQNLTLADSNAIAALKLPITGPAPTYGGSSPIVAPSADTTATITGVTAAYEQISSLTMASGVFLSDVLPGVGGRDLAAGRRDRDHEHYAGERDRANTRDRAAQGGGRAPARYPAPVCGRGPGDQFWWSRSARPAMQAWQASDPPLRRLSRSAPMAPRTRRYWLVTACWRGYCFNLAMERIYLHYRFQVSM